MLVDAQLLVRAEMLGTIIMATFQPKALKGGELEKSVIRQGANLSATTSKISKYFLILKFIFN
jgi:hypothetical protein